MTNTVEHTPGPWTILYSEVIAAEIQTTGLKTFICDPYSGKLGMKLLPIDEREANALLIAAAPELLAACETFLNNSANAPVEARAFYVPAYNKIYAALSKAKGQP